MYFTLIKYLASLFTMLNFRLKLLPSRDLTQAVKKPAFLTHLYLPFLCFCLAHHKENDLYFVCNVLTINAVAGGSMNP